MVDPPRLRRFRRVRHPAAIPPRLGGVAAEGERVGPPTLPWRYENAGVGLTVRGYIKGRRTSVRVGQTPARSRLLHPLPWKDRRI